MILLELKIKSKVSDYGSKVQLTILEDSASIRGVPNTSKHDSDARHSVQGFRTIDAIPVLYCTLDKLL